MSKMHEVVSRRDAYKAAAVTVVILLVPIVASAFNETAGWGVFDFIIAGLVLFTTQLALIAVIKGPFTKAKRYMLVAAILFAVAMLWVQLAVGIFD